jgi:NAD(P)-dependent dehydrogenase (short-subunit alcohol dehydrogenase family)
MFLPSQKHLTEWWSIISIPLPLLFLLLLTLLLFWDSIIYPSLLSVLYPSSLKHLHHRVVLITGAGRSQGIGYHLASTFLRHECHVVLWDVDADALAQAKRTLTSEASARNQSGQSSQSSPPRIITQVVDVSDVVAVRSAASILRGMPNLSPISVLVHNAGIVHGKPITELTADNIQSTFSVNVMAQYISLQTFLPDMLRRNDGLVVTMSSMMGMMGGANLSDYCGSKWALLGLDESLRMELRRRDRDACGVRTLAVCPYMVNTGMFRGAFGENGQSSDATMLRRCMDSIRVALVPKLSPEAVAQAVVIAASRSLIPGGSSCGCGARGKLLVLPTRLSLIPALLRLFPIGMQEWILDLGGGTMGMNGFQGHSKNVVRAKHT